MRVCTRVMGMSLWPLMVGLFYLFLYLPMLILVFFSFNSDPYVFYWKSFTTKWYFKLFKSIEVWDALKNSIIVALTSTALSTLMGAVFVCYAGRRVVGQLQPLFYAILAMPEIVLAVSMLSFFSFTAVPLGFTTLIAGHTLLGLGYVVPIVSMQFIELDRRTIEAAYDLGATPSQVVRTIIIPLLRPALIAGGLLSFIISLDDFVFSFFCAGGSEQTLPMYIFAMIKAGASPVIAALSSIMLLFSSVLVLLFFALHLRK